MRRNFRTYDLAVEFYRESQTLTLSAHLKEQLSRAASSIVLNLAEGRGKSTTKDQVRFFTIALGSTRECEAILTLAGLVGSEPWNKLDRLGAHLYQLIKRAR